MPETKIPPPIVGIVFTLLMWLSAPYLPALATDKDSRDAIATVLLLAGALVAVAALVSFRRARTTVNPLQPERASSLVTGGIFRVSRNPMYLGMLIWLLSWAIYLNRPLLLLAPLLFVLVMNRMQIIPEERAMATLFGDEFEAYRARVRRWI